MGNGKMGAFAGFINEKCEIRQVETIKERDLWQAYERWCRAKKVRPERRASTWEWIKINLPAPAVKKMWDHGVAYYLGIKVKES